MFFFFFFSFTIGKGYKCVDFDSSTIELYPNNNTYYFYFQKEDKFIPNQIEFQYFSLNKEEKIIPEQGKAYSFTECNLTIKKNNENITEKLCFWDLPKEECPEDSFVLSTTEQMLVNSKTSKFCYFTSYLFTSASLRLTASNFVDSSNDFRYYSSHSSSPQSFTKNGLSLSFSSPILIQGLLDDTVGDNTEVLFSTMNNKNVYKPSQCDLIKFQNYGEKKISTNITPSIKCSNLNDAAFSTLLYSSIVILFFSLLMFLLNKFGCINFINFFSSPNRNDFISVGNNSDEESMINAFHDDSSVHEAQL